MESMGKNIMEFVNPVKFPVLAVAALSLCGGAWRVMSVLAGFVSVSLSNLMVNLVLVVGLGILLVQVCLAAYIGYGLGKKAGTLMQCVISGLVFGLLAGIIGWVISLGAGILQAIINGATGDLIAAVTGIIVGGAFSLAVMIGKTIASAVMAVLGGLVAGAKAQ
jgi:hypothetical protein